MIKHMQIMDIICMREYGQCMAVYVRIQIKFPSLAHIHPAFDIRAAKTLNIRHPNAKPCTMINM